MRPVLAALVLSMLLGVAPARAAMAPELLGVPLACFSSADGEFRQVGLLQVNEEADGLAYSFDTTYFSGTDNGTWSYDDAGAAAFADGPLAGSTLDAAPAGTTMPGDQVPGRSWPLLLQGFGDATAYCQSNLIEPRRTLAGEVPWVEQRTGLHVRLPAAYALYNISFGTYSQVIPHVRVARRGLWRLELLAGPCQPGAHCTSLAIFSAKRAPARELISFPKLRLARGVTGRQGSLGCGPHPGPANWGPAGSCGISLIVWHQGAINYAIEGSGLDRRALIRLANQSIRTG